jgi:uncharacterized protein YndB with AHSA1/START domain
VRSSRGTSTIFRGAFPVHVTEVEKDKRNVLRWDGEGAAVEADASGTNKTTVTMTFASIDDGRTLVEITEEGWRDSPEGRSASYGNCEGWTGMLCAAKVWLEHGIKLREGFYK